MNFKNSLPNTLSFLSRKHRTNTVLPAPSPKCG